MFRVARLKKKLSVAKLVQGLPNPISSSYYNRLEVGEHIPFPDIVRELAVALDMDVLKILDMAYKVYQQALIKRFQKELDIYLGKK